MVKILKSRLTKIAVASGQTHFVPGGISGGGWKEAIIQTAVNVGIEIVNNYIREQTRNAVKSVSSEIKNNRKRATSNELQLHRHTNRKFRKSRGRSTHRTYRKYKSTRKRRRTRYKRY